MIQHRLSVGMVTVSALVALVVTTLRVSAQEASADSSSLTESSRSGVGPPDIVDMPGLGPVDLNQLPPNIRRNVRIPGVVYDEAEEQYGDLPPVLNPPREDIPSTAGKQEAPTADLGTEPPPPKSEEERAAREQAVKDLYPEEDQSELE